MVMETDPLQIWLNGVKTSRSGSLSTQSLYKRVMAEFLAFSGTSAHAIEEEEQLVKVMRVSILLIAQ